MTKTTVVCLALILISAGMCIRSEIKCREYALRAEEKASASTITNMVMGDYSASAGQHIAVEVYGSGITAGDVLDGNNRQLIQYYVECLQRQLAAANEKLKQMDLEQYHNNTLNTVKEK